MTTQTFSIGFPDSSTMYPSRRQSPGSGVGLDRGAGGGLTGIDFSMATKVAGRGAAVPTGVLRTRAGVAGGSAVGEALATAVGAGEHATADTASSPIAAAAVMRTRGSRARRASI